MKMRWAVGLAVLTFAPPAGAGTYTIDFSAVAADAGSVVTTSFDTPEFRVQLNAVRVIGPGDPGYAGAIGIAATLDQFDVVIDPLVPGLRSPILLRSISATFAADTGPDYRWNGVADVDERGPMWTWRGTAPGTATFAPMPATGVNRFWLTQVSTTTAQMTGLTIEAVLSPSVPEPSGLLLLGIGAVIVATARRTIGVSGKPRP